MRKAEKVLHYLAIAAMCSGSLLLIAIVAATRNGILIWP